MQKVIVAEKPSVARDIAKVVGATQRKEGYFEGEGVIVSYALGHLTQLCEPGEIDEKYKSWRMEALPMLPKEIPLKVSQGTKAQFNILKKLLCDKKTDSVVCATDAGREGELIFRRIYQMCGCKKPVMRLWISSLTAQAIEEGLNSMRPMADYDALYQSAKCRAEADWLVGMNASRAYSLRYNAHLSVGRVQTPTLGLIVERQRQIESFVAQEYYEVTADFGPYQGLYADEKGNSRLLEEALARQIARRARGKSGVVTDVQSERKTTLPPLLFDLTALQRESNRRLGLSAQQTLDIAQALYERHKLLTYPRTDSRALPSDMRETAQQVLKGLKGPYAALAQGATQPGGTRVFDDKKVSDHHAIIPTKGQPRALNEKEQALYDMVVRRFIASFYPALIEQSVKITTRVGEDMYLTAAKTTISPGWREVEPQSGEDEGIPNINAGDTYPVKAASSKKKKTRPPAQHTEATLLGAMESAGHELEEELREQMRDRGLGTPATRAAIIERLLFVGYIKRKGKALIPTQKGIDLISILPKEIKSAQVTGQWEKGLSDMQKGNMQAQRFMQGIERFVTFLTDDAKKRRESVVFEKEEYRPKKSAPRRRAKPKAKT